MAFELFNRILVSDEDITNITVEGIEIGYEFKLQYPSYRGTFLSCIEKLEIRIDNQLIETPRIGFYINGKEVLINELAELFREYWFITDFAVLRIYGEGLEIGTKHKVEVLLRHRIPYTGYFGNYMVEDAACTKVLNVI
ncbi:MAG TPA: hypothetical protein GXX75_19570 [Clostridiales bacterium]|nr:hypothetical protein [Clostridiales bacterium]